MNKTNCNFTQSFGEAAEVLIAPQVTLTAKDVPGAILAKPVHECTVAVLKQWQQCRGANVSDKKACLQKR